MKEAVDSVPYFSFKSTPRSLREEWIQASETVIERGIFIQGPEVEKFEISWASILGSRFAIGVSNGQDGLILALRSLEIKSGDKVAVPAHSFIATHNAIISLDAIPISIDVNTHGLIDYKKLVQCQEELSAVIVVHLHGQVCEMDEIIEWAVARNIKVIEDASQAHLAMHKNEYAGTIGDVGVFSLYPTKNLGALGDAGIVVTNSEEINNQIRSLSNYGNTKGNKYNHERFGLNNRLDEIQAAILNVNLRYLQTWNNRRKEISNLYFDGLNELGIKFLQNQNTNSVWHHFCILHSERDRLQIDLKELGIGTEIHYPRLAALECERFSTTPRNRYPNAELIAKETLSLPISPWHTDEEINYVIEKLGELSK